jgi:hypothetical protein
MWLNLQPADRFENTTLPCMWWPSNLQVLPLCCQCAHCGGGVICEARLSAWQGGRSRAPECPCWVLRMGTHMLAPQKQGILASVTAGTVIVQLTFRWPGIRSVSSLAYCAISLCR